MMFSTRVQVFRTPKHELQLSVLRILYVPFMSVRYVTLVKSKEVIYYVVRLNV